MKSNIMIIVLVTLFALGVIITVIIASVANNPGKQPDDSTDTSSYFFSDDPNSESGAGFSGSDSDQSLDIPDVVTAVGNEIVSFARSLLDREEKIPFLENGATPKGFDNSGFIYYVLHEKGFLTCPRELQAQTTWGRRIKFNELKVGDLVFFCNEDDPAAAGYGGIYAGGGKMIACLMPGTYVDEIDISGSYHREHFYCGVSLS